MTCATFPTVSGDVISRYGIRCGISTHQPHLHAGVDFTGRTGDPVFAAAPGIVEKVFHNDGFTAMRGYGNVVVIRHPALGVWTSYNHLSRIDVNPGDEVYKGSRIGAIGNTTNGKFPTMIAHLHFEVRHATPDGSSPFPGPYGAYNINPELWLDSLGVMFRSGKFVVDRGVPCIIGARPETLARLVRAGSVPVRCGLGDAPGPIPWREVTMDNPSLPPDAYEPPEPDARGSAGGILAGAALLTGALLAARK